MNTGHILTLGAIVVFGALAASSNVRAMPVASLQQGTAGLGAVSVVDYRGHAYRPYRGYPRPRLYVRPGFTGYPSYGYYGAPLPAQVYYPTGPGFEDPGYAYHGNLSGCATDLGYGRWESCDK